MTNSLVPGETSLREQLLALLKKFWLPATAAATGSLVTAGLFLSVNFLSDTVGGDKDKVGGDKIGGDKIMHGDEIYIIRNEIQSIQNSITNIENSVNEIKQEIYILNQYFDNSEPSNPNEPSPAGNFTPVEEFGISSSISRTEEVLTEIQREINVVNVSNSSIGANLPMIYCVSEQNAPFVGQGKVPGSEVPLVSVLPNGSHYWAEKIYMGAW